MVELEGQILINKSLDFVRERVTDELKSQLVDLQQYSRRYSVVIAGIKTGMDEKKGGYSEGGCVDHYNGHRQAPQGRSTKQGKRDIIEGEFFYAKIKCEKY